MAYYPQQALQFGLAKESVRGVAEAAPTKWYPVLPTPEPSYGPVLLSDDGLRGIKAKLEPIAGRKIGQGKLKLILDPQTLGEFMNSLVGGVVSAQQGGTAAYQHTFTPAASGYQPQSYTFFVDFGIDVKVYSRCVVKALTFTCAVDNFITVDVDFLFQAETAGGSIGSPSYPTQQYMSFQHCDYKIAGVSNTNVKSWTLTIDNQAKALMQLALSQDIQDIVAPEPLLATGSMLIIFDSETERNKFLANTAVALRMLIEGGIIASTFNWTVDLPLTAAHYKAYPTQYEEGLLAANVDFEGYHNGTSQIIPVIMNEDTAY